jgi:drug/metabolite transporter (DMT)-like permease
LLGVCAIWGSTFVVVKNALADASPLVFLGLRFLLASAILVALFGRGFRAAGRGVVRAGGVIGALLFAGYIFQTVGLQYTTPSKSAFITTLSSVLVPLLAVVALRRRPSGWALAGLGIAAAGAYFLTIPTGEFALARGDSITFFCTIAFAGHIVAIAHYAPRYGFSALALGQVAAALLLAGAAIPLAAATGLELPRVAWTGNLLGALVITAALATVLAFSVQTWAQQFTPATHTAVIFTTEPVFAAVTSYLVLGEKLGARETLGAGLILAGVLVAELLGHTPPGVPGSPAANPEGDAGV